ncbi:MAG: acyl--CoA ligase family protein [Desulfurispora sp.]|uniref:acyl--CoA ligase family protein n=1 Tax=Desulfurispora sp. TaxID=3014275 RepID=UPI00404B4C22
MLKVNYEPLSPLQFLQRNAAVLPDKPAVRYGEQVYTYRQFYRRVLRLASALHRAGLQRGDKVAFLCPNTPPMLEAHFGVPWAGGALVSINIRLSAREIAYIINHSDSRFLFVDNELAPVIQPVLSELTGLKGIVNICDLSADRPLPGPDYEEFLAGGSEDDLPIPVEDENEVITINYTSGTTGLPKGVMYTHRGAYLNALGEVLHSAMDKSSSYLWTLPMFHCNGWCFTWGVIAAMATNVCLRKVDPAEVFRLIGQGLVSHMCAAPIVLSGMILYLEQNRVELPRPLHILTAGAPPSPTVIKNMESIGATVTQVYGLTEVYGPHSICEWQEQWDDLPVEKRAEIKARQGVPYITAVHMTVVDPATMQEVPRDGQTLGEIVMRGNNVMAGYYKQPEATAEAFRGGWFHSGDMAVVHPDGYVEIKDRLKDIIISGGENISTVEVENVIYQHPAVLEVAVVSTPDPKWGEVPKAFIMPKPGTSPTAEEIINFCRERIARYKVPKYIEFGELPKTATGKIQKFKLRDREWAGREKKVQG